MCGEFVVYNLMIEDIVCVGRPAGRGPATVYSCCASAASKFRVCSLGGDATSRKKLRIAFWEYADSYQNTVLANLKNQLKIIGPLNFNKNIHYKRVYF